ncbi:50S ribosomal protein L22 [Cystobasidium minutum MCA 4210]|uniref:60S ribosomal protein uL22 n=1 Tax=Cystobasidium minutum MCA 4210 TaxID=1397322 RepID=UPI0034D0161D|eukprot:jgi/Rhomi1/166183/fgenesh1_kg.1_\
MGVRYSQKEIVGENKLKRGLSRGTYLRVHYKNTLETAALLNGMSLQKGLKILDEVTEHKTCVPFRRHNGGIGRTAQAKQWKATQGRWPVKSAKFLRGLLKNAEANAVANELTPEDLVIRNIVVQQAPKTRRRTYRAHGRINPYQGHPCHIEVILAPIGEEVPKAKEDIMEIETEGRRQTRGEIEA